MKKMFFRILGFRDKERAVAEVSGSSEERPDDASEEAPPEGPPAESGARPEIAVRAEAAANASVEKRILHSEIKQSAKTRKLS